MVAHRCQVWSALQGVLAKPKYLDGSVGVLLLTRQKRRRRYRHVGFCVAASAMEMSAIAAHNSALLAVQHLQGSGARRRDTTRKRSML